MSTRDTNLPERAWGPLAKKVGLIALIGSGAVLAIEPSHSRDLSLIAAFGLWFTHIVFIAGILLLLFNVGRRLGQPALAVAIMTIVLTPFLFAPFSLALDYLFGMPDEELLSSPNFWNAYLSEVLAIAPFGMLVAGGLSYVFMREVDSRKKAKTEAGGQPLNQSDFRLRSLSRTIPLQLGDDLISLNAQDHYVEVVTPKGRALISEKLSDCIERTSPLKGIQSHRSHWVNLDHIDLVKRAGSAHVCIMSNGDQIPLSRRRHTELKRQFAQDDLSVNRPTD